MLDNMVAPHTVDGMTLANLARADTLTDRLATEIKAMLARRSQSQSALAAALGVPAMWVSDRLSGKTQITVNDLARVAEVFEIHSWELVQSADGGPTIRYDSVAGRPNVRQPVVHPLNRRDSRGPSSRRAVRTRPPVAA